ncbi:hypothetical protein KW782_01375 [Candidatus Parcubacteria bacterium]|nr:hypothetical protein [Candidatus Parcubacteria bacterium]
MKIRKSNIGLVLSLIYIVVSIFFISTQGLLGESFITLILGLPWSMIPAFFEYAHSTSIILYISLIVPLIVNVFVLYWIGSFFDRKKPEATFPPSHL